jgi:predicted XRE-type DNA-binding protein
MSKLTYKNIFDAISDDPQDAADLEFRADLMIAMRRYFEDRGWKQTDIGNKLGIPQPRVSELVNGKINLLSSDRLIGYFAKLGFRFKPVYKVSTGQKASTLKVNVEDCANV